MKNYTLKNKFYQNQKEYFSIIVYKYQLLILKYQATSEDEHGLLTIIKRLVEKEPGIF